MIKFKQFIEAQKRSFIVNKDKNTTTCILKVFFDTNDMGYQEQNDFEKHCNQCGITQYRGWFTFIGMTVCKGDDIFDEKIGKNIAYYKAKRHMLKVISGAIVKHETKLVTQIREWNRQMCEAMTFNQNKLEQALNYADPNFKEDLKETLNVMANKK